MEGRRARQKIRAASTWDGLTQLAVLGACFLAGALGGFFFSSAFDGSGELMGYLQRYLQLIGLGDGMEPTLPSSVWDMVRWPLAAFLLGYSALGAIGLPVLMFIRGFILSFASATFVRLFGLSGLAVAAVAFGLSVLLAIPVLFVIAQGAFQQSLGRLSGMEPTAMAWRDRLKPLVPCMGLLILAVALQQTVMPALLTAVCARLFVP